MKQRIKAACIYLAITTAVLGGILLAARPAVEFAEIENDYSLDNPAIAKAIFDYFDMNPQISLDETAIFTGPYLVWDIVGDELGEPLIDTPTLHVTGALICIYENDSFWKYMIVRYSDTFEYSAMTFDFSPTEPGASGEYFCVLNDVSYFRGLITKDKIIEDPEFMRYFFGIDLTDGKREYLHYESEIDYAAVARYHGRKMLRRSLEAYEPQTKTFTELQKLTSEVTT